MFFWGYCVSLKIYFFHYFLIWITLLSHTRVLARRFNREPILLCTLVSQFASKAGWSECPPNYNKLIEKIIDGHVCHVLYKVSMYASVWWFHWGMHHFQKVNHCFGGLSISINLKLWKYWSEYFSRFPRIKLQLLVRLSQQ